MDDSGTMADVERFFAQADGKPGDPLSAEDEAFLAEHRAEIEAMIGEAAVKGADWERARIRRELLEWLDRQPSYAEQWVHRGDFRAALDRIAPSEGRE